MRTINKQVLRLRKLSKKYLNQYSVPGIQYLYKYLAKIGLKIIEIIEFKVSYLLLSYSFWVVFLLYRFGSSLNLRSTCRQVFKLYKIYFNKEARILIKAQIQFLFLKIADLK